MKNISLLLIMLALLAQACSSSEGKSELPGKISEAIPVETMTLSKVTTQSDIQTAGLFTTDDETNLSFKTGGVIERIFVREGDAISKGQLLAKLNLTEIDAQVAQAKLGFDKATRDFTRAENLYRDSVATLEQFQNSRTAMEVASRQLETANFNRSYSEIHAVDNGFVLRKMANEGQVITSGTPVFQTNGAGKGKWILKVGISDSEWGLVEIGNKANVFVDALSDHAFDAVVTRKSESTDALNGSFTIDLTIKNPGKELAAGLFGNAVIHASKKLSAWKIPYQAILDGDGDSGYVFVTDDNTTARKVSVTIDSIKKDEVIITAGLENATQLIISGSAYLKAGAKISVNNTTKKKLL